MSKYLVGTRPSGRLHLGHYGSVIKPAIEYGDDITVLVARYHAPHEDYTLMTAQLRSLGVENFKVQNIDLRKFFRLLELTPSSLLNSMPQYKAKEKNGLMYTYPVLMAHDLIGYDYVIVGEDQKSHIEFARDILPRIGEKCPEVIYSDYKIMDLRRPEDKMSKSSPNSCLFLDDKDYAKKISKAVTTKEGRKNLENIYYLLSTPELHTSTALIENIDNFQLKQLIMGLYEDIFVRKK